MNSRQLGKVIGLAAASALLRAQSYDMLNMVRNPQMPYAKLLEVEAGLLGTAAGTKDPDAGLENGVGLDGHLYYHDESFSGKGGQLDAYGGTDGILGSLRSGSVVADETVSRLELKTRLWPFYREGAWRGSKFVPTGRYQGRDYEAYLGFGKEVAQGLYAEIGPFYRRNTFDRNGTTSAAYVVPDDYNAYGARIFLEQSTVQLDRRRGSPRDGFLVTVLGEREWNDSKTAFGTTGGFQTELPSGVWRLRGRAEWYAPQSDDSTWEIFLNGSYTDSKDRVYEYDAQHPQGSLWGDGQVRLRFDVADYLTIAPFAQIQYTRILNEAGGSSDHKVFFGGGAEGMLHFSEQISIDGWYSYLDSESRQPVSPTKDVHGQHMFFIGLILRFGGQRH